MGQLYGHHYFIFKSDSTSNNLLRLYTKKFKNFKLIINVYIIF